MVTKSNRELAAKKNKQGTLFFLALIASLPSSVSFWMIFNSFSEITAWWGVVYFSFFILLTYYLIYCRREAFWSVVLEAVLPSMMFSSLSVGGSFKWLKDDIGVSVVQAFLGSVGSGVLIAVIVGGLYLYLYDFKYWHQVKDINLKYKINLKKGTFKLGQPWAGTYQYTDGHSHWLKAIPVLGAGFGVGIVSLFPAENAMLFLSCLVLNALAGIFAAHKLHYLYRVLQFERQIGKRLIIE